MGDLSKVYLGQNESNPTKQNSVIRQLLENVSPGVRKRLSADTTFNVATTGSDTTGDGSSLKPWATIQNAVAQVCLNYDLAGNTATIKLADGTYSESVSLFPYAGGLDTGHAISGGSLFVILGNQSSPGNVIIAPPSGENCFAAVGCAYQQYLLSGMTMGTTGGASCLLADVGGWLVVGPDVVFGSAGTYHLQAENGGIVELWNNYTVTGGGDGHFLATNAGFIIYNTITVTFTGSPTFSNATGVNQNGGNAFTSGVTWAGTVHGPNFYLASAGTFTGYTALPGDAAGVDTDYAAAVGGSTSLTNSTTVNIASVSLGLGTWDISGTVLFVPAATTTVNAATTILSTTSASLLPIDKMGENTQPYMGQTLGGFASEFMQQVGPSRLVVTSSPTPVYLTATGFFGTSTMTANGLIRATLIK